MPAGREARIEALRGITDKQGEGTQISDIAGQLGPRGER